MTSSGVDHHVHLLEDVYVGIFQRDLDDGGRKAYVDALAAGSMKLSAILRALLTSEEFACRVSDLTAIRRWKKLVVDVPDLVKSSYEAILNRPCDPGGLQYYSIKLAEQEVAAGEFLRCLASSPEAQARINSVSAQAAGVALTASSDVDCELDYRFRAELLSAGFRLQLV